MNRQLKRHPQHPLLPILYPSTKRILDGKSKKSSTSPKGNPSRRRGKWKVI